MVRINLIQPKFLADQHLIAEYREILLLMGHVKKHPKINNNHTTFHIYHPIIFFKNRLRYIENRFYKLVAEMKRRGFKPTRYFPHGSAPSYLYKLSYSPSISDKKQIVDRIKLRVRQKPEWYRYYGNYPGKKFFMDLLSYAH